MFPDPGPTHGFRWTQYASMQGERAGRPRIDYNASRIIGTIPAEPGTSVLDLDEGEVFASPVVCWLISQMGVVPLTVRGPHDGVEGFDYVVEFPDGCIIAPTVGRWVNRAAWMRGMGVSVPRRAQRSDPAATAPKT